MKRFFITVLFAGLFVTASSVWASGDIQTDKAQTKVEKKEVPAAKAGETKACCADKTAKAGETKACCADKTAKAGEKKACCSDKTAKAGEKKACCTTKKAATAEVKSSEKK